MKNVLVLISTYNGEKYLNQQLESVFAQNGVKVSALVRDDGSTDRTLEILDEWKKKENLNYYVGDNIKPARSFMNLIINAYKSDYYAFCDQDDYWEPQKLAKAVEKLCDYESIPSLYMSATKIVDENLNFIKYNGVNSYNNLENALIKNEAVGCTEVFNYELMKMLKKYEPKFIKMHDSWVCRVCYAVGGHVFVDKNSYIKYRQHENNVLGYRQPKLEKLKLQFKEAFINGIRIRQQIANELIIGYQPYISNENMKLLRSLKNYPSDINSKMYLLKDNDFKTPYKSINLKMRIAIILNKF